MNRDDIREMIGPYGTFTKSREGAVSTIEEAAAYALLSQGYDEVVIDACHVNPKYERRWHNFAENYTFIGPGLLEVYVDDSFLDVPFTTCMDRDAKRERSVGEDVITRMYESAQKHGYYDNRAANSYAIMDVVNQHSNADTA